MAAHPPPAALSGRGAALVRAAVAAAVLGLFARTFVLAPALVPSGSMSPALLAGDRILVNRLVYAAAPAVLAPLLPVREPRRGDVLWLRSPDEPQAYLVKRCAAVGGESFAGRRLGGGEIAVLGDRREDSRDSRQFGPLARGAVAGRVSLVLWSRERGTGVRWGRLLRPVR